MKNRIYKMIYRMACNYLQKKAYKRIMSKRELFTAVTMLKFAELINN